MAGLYRLGGLVAALLLSVNVYAGEVLVEGAWSRATVPGQDAAMVDLSITSEQAATLIGFSSPACKVVELHSMTHEDGVMKMREVKALPLPPAQQINLAESGYHLMLLGLKAPLKAGEAVPLTLTVQLSGRGAVKVEAIAEVRPLVASTPQDAGHMHHHH